MPPRPKWTPERIARFKELWMAGVHADAIGAEMGIKRTAVYARAHEASLPRRDSQGDGSGTKGRVASERPTKLTREMIAAPVPQTNLVERLEGAQGGGPGVGMADLKRGQCPWPLWKQGEAPTFRCCGEPIDGAGPYCVEHNARAYNPDAGRDSR